MAKYNTFVVCDCKKRKNLLVTSSARKAKSNIQTGIKVEVWNENVRIEVIYAKTMENIDKYVLEEKKYITIKQHEAELKNRRRKSYGL